MSRYQKGLIFGFTSYTIWGLFPLYWPLLKPANPMEIVSHRAVWSLIICLIAVGIGKQFKETLAMLRNPRIALRFAVAAFFISVNWLTYIYAVNHQQIV